MVNEKALIKDLNSRNAIERLIATRLLGHSKKKHVVKHLVKRLSDPISAVRLESIWSLSKTKPKGKSEDLAIVAKFDPDLETRLHAMDALVLYNDRYTYETAQYMYSSDVDDAKLVAARVLYNFGDRSMIKTIIAALDDDREIVKLWAVQSLGDFKDIRAVNPLLEALNKDEDEAVLIATFRALREIGSNLCLPLVLDFYNEAEGRVRKEAGITIDRIGQKHGCESRAEIEKIGQKILETIEKIHSVKRKTLKKTIEELIKLLTKFPDHQILEELVDIVSGTNEQDVRVGIVNAIGAMGSMDVIQLLVVTLDDPKKNVRKAATDDIDKIAKKFGFDPKEVVKYFT